MTNKEWEQYDHMERDERELQACIDFARKEGREEGRKIGREEGRSEIFSHVAAILGISLEDVMTMAGSISRKA